ncbi:MAG: sugar phosphate isomerase/epimerase family protein [Akkermansiaceae bacterium]|nr:sugar phosphate isomerase/epimerase family protein [Akkermansiaceae bacterium]
MKASKYASSRRRFLTQSALLATAGLHGLRAWAQNESPGLFTRIGTTGGPDSAAALKKQGIDFMTGSTSGFLVPDQPDEVFEKHLQALKACPLPMLACNGFIRPKHLRCVGEEANHDEVLEWAGTCFRRLQQAGGKFIVFGSGGSRALRNGWTVDQADPQFVALLKRMGPLAARHDIMVVLEQLNTRECNYINRIEHSSRLVREVDHPNVRVLADLYHMAMEGDTPEDLKKAMDLVAQVEIAEKEGRAHPGFGGQDFTPYFRVLAEAGYHGAINIEGRGKVDQLSKAVETIRAQEAVVL